jgi:hypothetical protein
MLLRCDNFEKFFLSYRKTMETTTLTLADLWKKRGYCLMHNLKFKSLVSHWVQYHCNVCWDCGRSVTYNNWYRHATSAFHKKSEQTQHCKTALKILEKIEGNKERFRFILTFTEGIIRIDREMDNIRFPPRNLVNLNSDMNPPSCIIEDNINIYIPSISFTIFRCYPI